MPHQMHVENSYFCFEALWCFLEITIDKGDKNDMSISWSSFMLPKWGEIWRTSLYCHFDSSETQTIFYTVVFKIIFDTDKKIGWKDLNVDIFIKL